jgi:hypothetical protein
MSDLFRKNLYFMAEKLIKQHVLWAVFPRFVEGVRDTLDIPRPFLIKAKNPHQF